MAQVDCPALNEAASRATDLGARLQDQAMGQAKQLQDRAMGQAKQLQDQAMGQVKQLQDQAMSQVNQLQDQAKQMQDKAQQLQGQAQQLHDQAMGQAQQLQDHAMGQAQQLQDQAMGQAKQLQDKAMGEVAALQGKAAAMQAQATDMMSDFPAKLASMLVLPPAVASLMQEASAQPLPEKEQVRESDLAPFADDEEDETHDEEPEEESEPEHKKPMSMAEWLQAQLDAHLASLAKRLARHSGGGGASDEDPDHDPHGVGPGGGDDDGMSIEDWAQGQMAGLMGQLAKKFPPPDTDEAEQAMQQMQDTHPEAPPYDDETAGALAGLAETGNMLSDLIGKNFLDPSAAGELQELVGSFSACASAIPPIDPGQLNTMNIAGGMAKAVEMVRSRFGIDMLQQNIGSKLAQALSAARALDPSKLQEAAAQRAAKWLPLAAFAKSINLPVSGPAALQRIGQAAKWVSSVKMPDAGMASKQLAETLGHMDNAAAVKRVFGVDPSAKGAGAALAPMLARVNSNAQDAMSRASGVAQKGSGMASQLSRSSLAEVTKIDRSQAKDLAIGKIRQASTPVLSKAMPVLSTLQSVRQATGKSVTMPSRSRTRRS